MSRWFRVYDDLVDDPKVQRLSGEMVKALLNLWCLASQNNGLLPAADDIAFKLRMKPDKVQNLLSVLGECGLIDFDEKGLTPHNWNIRQFKSDVSNERVKRHRERKCNVTDTVTVTSPDTEQIQSRTDIAADAAPPGNGKYQFESGIIRLTAKDFSKWERAFSHLDLAAELVGLTHWAGEQGPENWFFAVSGALAKRNRELKKQADQARNGGPALPLTPSGNAWPEGIV